MKYMIYRTTNNINGKIYVGFHKFDPDAPDDGYIGSGKLIRSAIKKYGKQNFTREILYVFDSKADAEAKEREIVNEHFVKLTTNYNLSVGGNVCILFGENNGFYGKTHSQETKEKIQIGFKKFIETNGFLRSTKWACIVGDTFYPNKDSFCDKFNIKKNNVYKIIKKVCSNGYFIDDDFNSYAITLITKIESHRKIMKIKRANDTSIRFKGVPKSDSQKQKIRESHQGKPHYWQDKVNKNPEKIEKTRLKHLGSKRSKEACANIKEGQLKYTNSPDYKNSVKGKVCFHDPLTKKISFFEVGFEPEGWIKGNPATSKKCYYDPETNECKRFNDNDVPDGWVRGNPNMKKKRK